jgi:hypothetical protein
MFMVMFDIYPLMVNITETDSVRSLPGVSNSDGYARLRDLGFQQDISTYLYLFSDHAWLIG